MNANAAKNATLRELVLYVARRCEQHHLFGIVKLNKILFYADRSAFVRKGATISGVEYVKAINGPVPDGMSALIEKMTKEGALVEIERDMPDGTIQRRPIAIERENLSKLDAEDIATVEEVIEWMRPMSAHRVSELTHELAGWTAARFGEKIPHGTAYVPEAPISLTDDESARVESALAALA